MSGSTPLRCSSHPRLRFLFSDVAAWPRRRRHQELTRPTWSAASLGFARGAITGHDGTKIMTEGNAIPTLIRHRVRALRTEIIRPPPERRREPVRAAPDRIKRHGAAADRDHRYISERSTSPLICHAAQPGKILVELDVEGRRAGETSRVGLMPRRRRVLKVLETDPLLAVEPRREARVPRSVPRSGIGRCRIAVAAVALSIVVAVAGSSSYETGREPPGREPLGEGSAGAARVVDRSPVDQDIQDTSS